MESRLARVERRMEEESSNILEITRDHSKTLEFLRSNGLLKDNFMCSLCNNNMRIIKNKNKLDLQQFRCKPCGKAQSIRYDSLFSNSKLSLIEFVRIAFYYFIDGYSTKEVQEKTTIDGKNISQIYIQLREFISNYLQQTYIGNPMGGPYYEVVLPDDQYIYEVDESLFSHIDGQQVWVLGIVVRGTGEARC